MAGVLAKIEPLNPEMIPPRGDDGKPAVVIGQTPDGRTLYRRRLIRSEKLRDIDPKTGEQRWELHPTTAQPLYRRWVRKRLEFDQTFFMESDGKGNLYIRAYQEPTPEELERKEKAAKAAQFKDDLARLAAERNISAEALLARLMDDAATDEEPDEEGAVEYPENYAPGRWRLSNGSTMQGKREEAEAAEAALKAPDDLPAH